MEINLNKARKLIDELEKTLNETATHTSSAREVIGQWMSSGEAKLRKKSGVALRQVRKRADRFTVALSKLEKDFAKSLEKLSETVEKKEAKKPVTKKKPAGKAKKAKAPAKKTVKKAPAKTVEKVAGKKAPAKRKRTKKAATK